MNNEIWKAVPGFGGHYEASSFGRIRSKDRTIKKRHQSGVVMNQKYKSKMLLLTDDRGYLKVHLGVDKRKFCVSVHHLVALAFHGAPSEGQLCRHINDNPKDNRPENLAWGTQTENMADRMRNGNYKVGELHPMAKLNENQVRAIRKSSGTYASIAHAFKTSTSNVCRIRKLEIWKNV